ncbi:hypothetical protein HPB47_000029, partial [Ixodes persulcatus]
QVKSNHVMQISYDDDLKCITGVVQASMRNKSYVVETASSTAAFDEGDVATGEELAQPSSLREALIAVAVSAAET